MNGVAACQYDSRCFVCIYNLCTGFLVLGQIAIIVLLCLPNFREMIFNDFGIHNITIEQACNDTSIKEVTSAIESHVDYTGIALGVFAALQVLNMVLMGCHSRRKKLSSSHSRSGSPRKDPLYQRIESPPSSRGTAKGRYKDKHASIFDKYRRGNT